MYDVNDISAHVTHIILRHRCECMRKHGRDVLPSVYEVPSHHDDSEELTCHHTDDD